MKIKWINYSSYSKYTGRRFMKQNASKLCDKNDRKLTKFYLMYIFSQLYSILIVSTMLLHNINFFYNSLDDGLNFSKPITWLKLALWNRSRSMSRNLQTWTRLWKFLYLPLLNYWLSQSWLLQQYLVT